MKKIIQALVITLSQFLVFAQPNDLETPVSIINDGLDTQAQMGSVFTLNGTNSYDPNGTIVSYDWSQSPNGTQVELSSESGSIVTFTVPTESDENPNMPGGDGDVICIIWLTVTDNDGLTDMSQITITGVEGEPPVSVINDGSLNATAQIGTEFTLDGSNSYDSDGLITEYSWSQSQNGDQVIFNSTDETVVTFTVPEESPNDISDSSVTCIIYLTVTDNDGNTDMSQVIVTGLLNDGGQQLELSDVSNTPDKFKLNQNYPNPFNPVTTLGYDLPEQGLVNITVYDMLGNIINELVNEVQYSGYKSIQWNATNNQGQPVSTGVYLYSIKAGEFRQTKKMILLK
jgi:hypothetical protein